MRWILPRGEQFAQSLASARSGHDLDGLGTNLGLESEQFRIEEELDARHLTEDIPHGLVTYCELGRLTGIPTPVSEAIVTIASGLLDRDFRAEGRSLEKLGFDPSWDVGRLYFNNLTKNRNWHDGATSWRLAPGPDVFF